jgi:ATP-dependent 26S proteasome regulatory subunit
VSLLIAATNHEHLLDSALWRRFDEVLPFPRASVHQIRRLLRLRLRTVKHQALDIEGSASRLKGKPHAAVEKAAWDAVRFSVLDNRDTVEQRDLDRAVADVLRRPW